MRSAKRASVAGKICCHFYADGGAAAVRWSVNNTNTRIAFIRFAERGARVVVSFLSPDRVCVVYIYVIGSTFPQNIICAAQRVRHTAKSPIDPPPDIESIVAIGRHGTAGELLAIELQPPIELYSVRESECATCCRAASPPPPSYCCACVSE